MDGNVDLIAILILDAQKLACQPFERALNQAGIVSNAVIHVNDPVAGMQVRISSFGGLGARSRALAWLRSLPAKDLRIGNKK